MPDSDPGGISDVTQANFETVLADYFTAAVAEEPTTVATLGQYRLSRRRNHLRGAEPAIAVCEFRELELFINTTGISVSGMIPAGQPAGRYQQLCRRQLFADRPACHRQHHA